MYRIEVRGNRFSGAIPGNVSSLRLLSVLDLTGNPLTGALIHSSTRARLPPYDAPVPSCTIRSAHSLR